MAKFQHDKYTLKAISVIRDGHSLFISGKAGTGKTMLLRKIVEKEKIRGRNVAVCAPTGVAAKNADGVTLHSFLRLPISIYIPGHKVNGLYSLDQYEQEAVRMLDLLIIDEVSMVRCDLMDMVDDVLRHYRGSDKPFGGLQIILFGDLKQLMPVVEDEDKSKLDKYYTTPYFFSSRVISKMGLPMLELKKVHRQSDSNFISMLNRIRDGKLTDEDERTLRYKYDKDFDAADDRHYIRLTTHRSKAKGYNRSKLETLRGFVHEYKAYTEGYYPQENFPNDYVLRLKDGARVMFVANDKEGRYVNGTLGTVVYADVDGIEVRTDDGKIIDVTRCTWKIYHYIVNKELKKVEPDLLGSFTQYPLRLAWAVTIHKSQGLTFDNVVIDAGRAFTYGQVYVALSRCKTLDGIVLTSRITREVVKSDPKVDEYMQLVKRMWPDGETGAEQDEKDSAKEEIEALGYTQIGHGFKAPWDGSLYDAWEDVSNRYYVDKLVQKDGATHRLCVGIISDRSPLFEILLNRDYKKIKSWKHLGGKSSIIDVIVDGKTQKRNFFGSKYQEANSSFTENEEIWDATPNLRSYDFTQSVDILKILKTSNNSSPSEMKVYSDMGKLLLCCDCCKILRNDSREYCVAVEDGSYKVLHYSMDGKALDERSQMIADKWYQKYPDKVIVKKSHKKAPETQSTEMVVKTQPVKTKSGKGNKIKSAETISVKKKKAVKPVNPAEKYPEGSLERRIIVCMQRSGCRYAQAIANTIGADRIEVNRALYGVLSKDGVVEFSFNTWKLKK